MNAASESVALCASKFVRPPSLCASNFLLGLQVCSDAEVSQ